MIFREIASLLQRLSKQYPVVTVTGPRQSGKTTLCKQCFPDHSYYNLEDLELRALAQADPKSFINSLQTPAIIDEIQYVPELASGIQVIVDETQQNGQFILTGSQQLGLSQSISQSLAGRTALIKLLPLSYSELYQDKSTDLDQLLYDGFYPRIHNNKLEANEALAYYLATYVERDVRQLINLRNLSSFQHLLKLLATQVGQLVNYTTLANDCGVDQKTIKAWISVLEARFIIFLLKPFHKKTRKRLTKTPKLYFYDVGLVSHLLGITHKEQIAAHPLRGSLFENFIVIETLKQRYNKGQNNNLYFYRDTSGNEIDLILEHPLQDQFFEIKSSQSFTPSLLSSLIKQHKYFDQDSLKQGLIYAGTQQQRLNGIQLIPYFALAKFVKD